MRNLHLYRYMTILQLFLYRLVALPELGIYAACMCASPCFVQHRLSAIAWRSSAIHEMENAWFGADFLLLFASSNIEHQLLCACAMQMADPSQRWLSLGGQSCHWHALPSQGSPFCFSIQMWHQWLLQLADECLESVQTFTLAAEELSLSLSSSLSSTLKDAGASAAGTLNNRSWMFKHVYMGKASSTDHAWHWMLKI